MIIRLVTPTRQLRLQTEPSDNLHDLITQKLNLSDYTASLSSSFDPKINPNDTLSNLKISQGTTIFIDCSDKVEIKREKKVQRDKSILCNHDSNAMCSNCAPLDPWDMNYHKENKIKYLSFNSYLEMHKKEKILLEPLNYEKKECDRHGNNVVCSSCQQKSVALMPQVYRMIDHIEFDNRSVIDYFVSFWRGSNRQRVGFLIGKEENYDLVPMGKKVKVSWIYECGQENFPDGFFIEDCIIERLFEKNIDKYNINDNINKKNINDNINKKKSIKIDIDETSNQDDIKIISSKKKTVNKESGNIDDIMSIDSEESEINLESNTSQISSKKHINIYKDDLKSVDSLKYFLKEFNMKIVGVIYTDMRERNFILSGLELNFLSKLQNLNKFYSNDLKSYFNSKFISIVLSKEKEEIELSEYQISEQGMELARNKIIGATEDPEKMILLNKNIEIFYRGLNEYKIASNIKAEPYLPIEYFIVKLTHGFKNNPFFNSVNYFDWRYNLKKMHKYFNNDFSLDNFSNLNLLIKLRMDDLLGDKIDLLIKSIQNKNYEDFNIFLNTEEFRNLKDNLECFNNPDWECKACTFVNSQAENCEMCGLPKE
ncbi:nuclear protein localization protein 4 [Gurleya vavrai]